MPRRSGLAAHKMVIVVDPANRAVRQLNGLASWFDTATQRWRHKPIGYLPSDRLRGYDTDAHPHTWLPINGAGAGGRDVSGAIANGDVIVMNDGAGALDASAVKIAIDPAIRALTRINALSDGAEGGGGLPYPFLGLGPNSNSFFTTLVAAMGLPQPRFPRPARFAPGCGRSLLPDREISNLRDRRMGADTLET